MNTVVVTYVRCKFGDGPWELLSADEFTQRVLLTADKFVTVDNVQQVNGVSTCRLDDLMPNGAR